MPCSCLVHYSWKELGTGAGSPIHNPVHWPQGPPSLSPWDLGGDIAHTAVLLGGFSVSALVRRLLCKCSSSIHAMTHSVSPFFSYGCINQPIPGMPSCKTHLYVPSVPHPSLLSVYASALITWIIKTNKQTTITLCGLLFISWWLCASLSGLPSQPWVQRKPVCGGREQAGNAHPFKAMSGSACCEWEAATPSSLPLPCSELTICLP